MIDFGLKPCPLCGGEAEVVRLAQGPENQSAVIKCTDCGLTLEWETDVRVGISRTGARTVIKTGLDPIEAWNRRTDDECSACGFKAYYERVGNMPDCNTCGDCTSCEYRPRPGAAVRINCPLWRAKEE